jgi:trimeric autotransporter adhesin
MRILGRSPGTRSVSRAVTAFIAIVSSALSWGAITGTVFQDFNGNGIKDIGGASGTPPVPLAADIGIAGVTVTATGVIGAGTDGVTGTADDVIGACSAPVTSSAITATLGAYSISTTACLPGTIVRIEFSGWPAGTAPGLGGSTTVQFVSLNATNVNLPLVDGSKFCENNPQLATSCYVYGNNLTGPNSASDVVVSFPLSAGGTSLPAGALPAPNHIATANQMGSTLASRGSQARSVCSPQHT